MADHEDEKHRAGATVAALRQALGAITPEQRAAMTPEQEKLIGPLLDKMDPRKPTKGKIREDDQEAREHGMSRTTVQRLRYILRMAADDTLPPEVREVAKQAWAEVEKAPIVHGGHGVIGPAYRRVQATMWAAGVEWQVPCESCGQPFQMLRRDAKFCSPACRQRAYRARRDAQV